jgi:hypothetical protein
MTTRLARRGYEAVMSRCDAEASQAASSQSCCRPYGHRSSVSRERCAPRAEPIWSQVHELVDGQLLAAFKQVDQRLRAVWRLEHVAVGELDHGKPAARSERVQRPGGFLLRLEQLIACLLPLLGRHDLRFCHVLGPPVIAVLCAQQAAGRRWRFSPTVIQTGVGRQIHRVRRP